jgi:hypothetical protein
MTTTDTTRADRGPALAANQAQAVLMVRNGKDLKLVEDETGLTRAQIAAAVGRADANRAARPTPANVQAPKPTPKPMAPASRYRSPVIEVTPTAVVNGADLDTVDELLEWAEKDGPARAQSLAAKIRLQVEELRGISRRAEQVADAQEQVERLTAQLSAAREALRLAGGQKAKAAAPAPIVERTRNLEIRAWARENGLEIGERGTIPAPVLAAYADAHPA